MKQNKLTGIIGTVILHAIVILLLFIIKLTPPEKEVEGGVPVMLGNMELAEGNSEVYELNEVDVLPEPAPAPPVENTPADAVDDPMITQPDEPSIQIEEKKEKKEKKKEEKKTEAKQPVQPQPKPVEKPREKTEAEKRAEAEKKAAQMAASKISGAFGKGSKMKGQGDAKGEGQQGRPDGTPTGNLQAEGGYGSFDLSGRSLGKGGLPKPAYNVQDEGRVVVTIVVDPQGRVINTSINKRTNTVNPSLRKAAEDAARKARFNAVDGVNNQTGTIVYYFNLR